MNRDASTTDRLARAVVGKVSLSLRKRTLDIGCGDGVFMAAAIRRLRRSKQCPSLAELAASIEGIEIQPQRAAEARRRLEQEFGRPLRGWNIAVSDALTVSDAESYDIIVGNPPFRRLHHVEENYRRFLRSHFQTAQGMFDLCHVFVEKAVRLLKPRGELCLIVPAGIEMQPAARRLREYLSQNGQYSIRPVNGTAFEQAVGAYPAILHFRKRRPRQPPRDSLSPQGSTLGDIATVSAGLATGANGIFLVTAQEARENRIERQLVRLVVRGRDIAHAREAAPDIRLVCPYRSSSGRVQLLPLSHFPAASRYLTLSRHELSTRPRLANTIRARPDSWYRYIDCPPWALAGALRVVVPDVFKQPSYLILRSPRTAVLNSAFVIRPRSAADTPRLLRAVKSPRFARALETRSRPLGSGYHRTSCAELMAIPIP